MNGTYQGGDREGLAGLASSTEAVMGGKSLKCGTAAALLLVFGLAQAQVKIGDNPTSINPGSALEAKAPTAACWCPAWP